MPIVEKLPQFTDDYDGGKMRVLIDTLEKRFRSISNALIDKRFSFRARRTTAQTGIVTATATLIQYNTKDWDVNGAYDNSAYRYTPTESAYYHVNASAIIASLGTGKYVELRIRKNGNDELAGPQYRNDSGGALDTQAIIEGDVYLDGNDYVDITLTHNHGSNLSTVVSIIGNYFSCFKVSSN